MVRMVSSLPTVLEFESNNLQTVIKRTCHSNNICLVSPHSAVSMSYSNHTVLVQIFQNMSLCVLNKNIFFQQGGIFCIVPTKCVEFGLNNVPN